MWSCVDKDKRTQAGVYFLIKRKHGQRITYCEEISGRFMQMDLDYLGPNIVVFGIYATTKH